MKKLALIACEALRPELERILDRYPNIVHVQFHKLGLHDNPDELRRELQTSVDFCETVAEVEAIILAYGLCSRSVEGLVAKRCEIVIPRVHDCRAVIIGSRRRFNEYEAANPGTYWYSPGWLLDRQRAPSKEKFQRLLAEYTQKYGSDNAEYLMSMENDWITQYSRAVYVDTGVGDVDEHKCFTRQCAQELDWAYDEIVGSDVFLKAMLSGDWDEENFLVLSPGTTPAMSDDEQVMIAVKNKER